MSFYNTVVLSFSSGEFDGEAPPADFGPLVAINAWLKDLRLKPLADLSKGKLGSNAVLFGGCYDGLNVPAFKKAVWSQRWQSPDDVQILVWDDNASKFSVIRQPAAGPARMAAEAKKRKK